MCESKLATRVHLSFHSNRFCQMVSYVMQLLLLSHFSNSDISRRIKKMKKMKMNIAKNNNHHYFNCALICAIVYDCPDFPFTFYHFHSIHCSGQHCILYCISIIIVKASPQCHIDLSFIHLNLMTWTGWLMPFISID